jgi:hypothetical protein
VKIILFISLLFILSHNATASELDYFLVASINSGVPCKQKTFFLREGDTLCFYLVLQYENKFFAALDSFYSEGTLFKTTKAFSQPITISWYEIQPKLQEYSNLWSRSNTKEGNIHLEPIDYIKKPLPEYTHKKCLDFSRTTKKNNLGTYYVTAEVILEGKSFDQINTFFSETSPLSQKYSFKIVQIVRRKDDTYIGYLTELLNTPFIIAPMMTQYGYHETDIRMGSDCAAFAIYGKRRQGYRVPYCGPRGIYKYLSEIGKGPLRSKKAFGTEIYVNKDAQSVTVGVDGIERGDIVHFGDQVSVFYEDLGINGFLDKDDLLFQCYKDAPHVTSIANSGFYPKPIRTFKWKNEQMKSD